MGTGRISIGEIGKAIVVTHDASALRRNAVLVLVAGLLLTTALSYLIWRGESAQIKAARDRDASEAQSVLERKFLVPYEIVYSIGSYFLASQHVSHTEFVRFSESALKRHSSVSALEWAPVVMGSIREELETRVIEEEGIEGFSIRALHADGSMHPSPQRPIYVPLLYIEPPSPGALGLDLASEPNRKQRLEKAAMSTTPIASEPFVLAEDKDGAQTIALYLGIPDAPLSLEETWGFAIALFRIGPIKEAAIEALKDRNLEFRLTDITEKDATPLFQTSGFQASQELLLRPLDFGGRRWQVETHERVLRRPTLTIITSTVGGSLSFLLGLLVLGFGRSRQLERDIEVAKEMGQYKMVERLGQGGMGVVYKARHALIQRDTAVKVLIGKDESSLQRFEREVQLNAQLSHPNTVSIYDYGRTENGEFYYVMELLDGVTLQEMVDRFGAMPLDRALHILLQITGSLREAHRRGVIHRDIKPDNIMITQLGGVYDFVKVLDFGLAKEVETDVKVTGVMEIIGTPLYMSPEAIQGQAIDAKSDVYSFGCVAHVILTSKNVFEATSIMEIMRLHENEAAPMLDTGDKELDELLFSCLAKEPGDRPSTHEIYEELEEILARHPWSQAEAEEWWSTHLMTAELQPLKRPQSGIVG